MSARARIALKIVVWLVGLAPLAAMAYWFWTDDLTANPIEFVTRNLGDWALRLLLASLAMTPLRLVFGLGWPLTLRRLLGLFAFAYVVLHFGVWIVLDHFFDWRTMADDIVKRPWITVGVAALALLVPARGHVDHRDDQAHGRRWRGAACTAWPTWRRCSAACTTSGWPRRCWCPRRSTRPCSCCCSRSARGTPRGVTCAGALPPDRS